MTTTTTQRVAPDSAADTEVPPGEERPLAMVRRSTIDKVLIAVGAVAAVVLAVAGGLLMWGSNFADDYVYRELSSQNIRFPDEEALRAEGRDDLVKYAGQLLTNGSQAEAYASYIGGHLEGIADGMTYADLGGPERAAKAAVTEAIESGASDEEIAELQAEANRITGQRDTLFKGETLRGLLLSTYAWSTVGQIAMIAAVAAFVAAGVMVILVIAGMVHMRRYHRRTTT
jgi:hypothetical protein